MPKTPAPMVPDYWEEAKAELMKRDRIMRKLIPQFGDLQLVGRGEPFVTLARSIVGQQISVKAAQAIWERLMEACPKMTPVAMQKLGLEKLAAVGLSKRKAEYLTDLSRHFRDGSVHEKDWSAMDDEAVIAELVQIRGIGRWTAEMFLIFGMGHPDIWSPGDLGLRKAVEAHFGMEQSSSEIAERWAPYRSYAALYLWEYVDKGENPAT